MSFEFFFGLFGLIPNSPRASDKRRLENDWRQFTSIEPDLFAAGNAKKAMDGSLGAGGFSGPGANAATPIFSTGTLVTANNSGKYRSKGLVLLLVLGKNH